MGIVARPLNANKAAKAQQYSLFGGPFPPFRGRQGSAIAKKLQKERDFCFCNGQITTTGTRPYEKRVDSPREGKSADPHKASSKTTRASKANSAESAKGTGYQQRRRGRTRETHTSPSEADRTDSVKGAGRATCNDSGADPRKKPHGPQQRWRGKSHDGGIQDKVGPQDKGPQYRYGTQDKKVRRNFSADPSKKINRYAIEASHSTMQLFRNGLESGASALTIRNFASPSAVFQTSVRKRTPGRTGEVKRHLKRVIASG